MRIYAIGDIHGQLALLDNAHREIAKDRARTGDQDAVVVHLGDLVDRGPDSRSVVDYLMKGMAAGEPWEVIKGNHDRMFAEFVRGAREDPKLFSGLTWMHPRLGGTATLASYGIVRGTLETKAALAKRAARAVPDEHLTFLENLPVFKQTVDLLFVHAGIRPGVLLEDQVEDDLIWIREEFLDDTRDHGRLIVHGHTPIEAATHYGNRVAIDTGAAFGGPLTTAVFEGRSVHILRDGTRYPLLPVE